MLFVNTATALSFSGRVAIGYGEPDSAILPVHTYQVDHFRGSGLTCRHALFGWWFGGTSMHYIHPPKGSTVGDLRDDFYCSIFACLFFVCVDLTTANDFICQTLTRSLVGRTVCVH